MKRSCFKNGSVSVPLFSSSRMYTLPKFRRFCKSFIAECIDKARCSVCRNSCRSCYISGKHEHVFSHKTKSPICISTAICFTERLSKDCFLCSGCEVLKGRPVMLCVAQHMVSLALQLEWLPHSFFNSCLGASAVRSPNSKPFCYTICSPSNHLLLKQCVNLSLRRWWNYVLPFFF
jgi:hypothetical protein